MKKKTFVLSDDSLNVYGFRLLTSGANLEHFRKNPVMYFNHDTFATPIGRWENIRIKDNKVLADAVFDMEDAEAAKIAGKVERDFIRMTSVGIMPIEWSDAPEHLLPGQTRATVTRWIVKEASIVGVGANHNALRLYDAEGKLLDDKEIIKLMFDTTVKLKNNKMNEKFLKIIALLNLADTATESDVETAITQLQSDTKRFKDENATFKARIDELNAAEQQQRTAQAISLTDEAVKDGRLNADARAEMLEMFELDFDKAKKVLSAIPKRMSVKDKLKGQQNLSDEAYQAMVKLSWDELDKKGKLSELRDNYPDLYDEKFEKRFGVKPSK